MPDTQSPALPSAIWGGLRWVQAQRISGWAFAPHRPREHLHVEVRLDGALIATARADQPLPYLESSGICPADHGFTIETGLRLPTDAPDRLEVTAVALAGTRLRLSLPSPADRKSAKPARKPGLRFVAADHRARPVFVLGAKRSGTSVLGRALRHTGRYAGHGEGHLLPLLAILRAQVRGWYEDHALTAAQGQFTMLAGTPERLLQDGLDSVFLRLARAAFPDADWMEKTPGAEAIHAAPLYRSLWPEARFVLMRRRGIENVASALRKFPETPFDRHCAAWTASMQAWADRRPDFGPAAIDIDQIDLARHQDAVATRLGAFLDLHPAQTALLRNALRTERPQQTAEDPAAILALAATGWTRAETDTFQALCGPTMDQFLYTDDATYRRAGLAAPPDLTDPTCAP